MMTEAEAREYVPQWGSYMRAGDPGYIMYTAVPPERAEHRDEMAAHVRSHCLPIAHSEHGEPEDVERLRDLLAYLAALEYPAAAN